MVATLPSLQPLASLRRMIPATILPCGTKHKEICMRRGLFGIGILFLLAVNAFAQTADDIIAKYISTVGGKDRIAAVTSRECCNKT